MNQIGQEQLQQATNMRQHLAFAELASGTLAVRRQQRLQCKAVHNNAKLCSQSLDADVVAQSDIGAFTCGCNVKWQCFCPAARAGRQILHIDTQEAAEECATAQTLMMDSILVCCTKLANVRQLARDVRQLKLDVSRLHALMMQHASGAGLTD